MKHRIVTEDQNDEDVIEWKLALDEHGFPCLLARKQVGWQFIAWADEDNRFSVARGTLQTLGFEVFDFD